jgi:quinol monooxygenase YgiN
MLRRAKKQLVCIAQFTAKPGRQNQLMESISKLMQLTHKEKGCIPYELNQHNSNPRIVTLVEKWADQKAFDQHCAMPYIIEYFRDVVPRLVARHAVSMHTEILP